jgi:hypothetical protein
VIGVLPPTFRFPKKDDLGPLARLAERTEMFMPLQEGRPGWGGDYDYIVLGPEFSAPKQQASPRKEVIVT